MTNVEHMEIVRHVELAELERMIESLESSDMTRAEKDRMKERLSFVRLRYKGYSVAKATDALMVNRQSGYNWQAAWNEHGFEGLIPGFDGGAPSKLSKDQKHDLAQYVLGRELCTDSVCDYVKSAYGVEYSGMQIGRILRSEGLVYRRGYKIDYRRPKDPEGILKKTSEWYWTNS